MSNVDAACVATTKSASDQSPRAEVKSKETTDVAEAAYTCHLLNKRNKKMKRKAPKIGGQVMFEPNNCTPETSDAMYVEKK